MNFVDFVIDCYTHITSHVTQVFASCTHYTSYSLPNIVHVIMCVFRSDQPSLKLLWVFFFFFVQNIFCVWDFKGRMFENLNFGNSGFKTCVVEKHFISYSCILFLIFNALRSVFKNQVVFLQNSVFAYFRLIQSVFNQSKFILKFYVSLYLFQLIETVFRSIEYHESGFFKNKSWHFQTHFFKSF